MYDPKLVEPLAHVLGRLGATSAFVVHGEGGLDEITITGTTRMARLKDGEVAMMEVTPEELGLKRATLEDVLGGSVEQCRAHTLDVLSGQKGPKRDMVLMNAAAALVAAGQAPDMAQGVVLAAQLIDSGAALGKLEDLVSFSKSLRLKAAEA